MIDLNSFCTNLVKKDDRIWYARNQDNVSYPEDGNKICYEIEDRSFWFTHRNACIVALINRFPPLKGTPVFDIGGGNGCVSGALLKGGYEPILVEPGFQGIKNAQERGLNNLVCSTFEHAGFIEGSMGCVGLFDVIEHIEDDICMLKSLYKLVKTGGKIYISVPAYQFLWSDKDISAGHYRRYSMSTIAKMVENSGFRVLFGTHIFRFLPIPIYLLRTLPTKLGFRSKAKVKSQAEQSHVLKDNSFKTVLNHVQASEIRNIQSGSSMRWGGSCLLVAEKT